MCDENDDLYFTSSKTISDEDMEKMSKLCEAAHDQENERLKAKFLELADMAGDEKKYELYRYRRFNMHIEIILRAETTWDEDELISMIFDGKNWTYLHGACSRETFDDALGAVGDLWDSIKDYVIENERNFGTPVDNKDSE